MKRMNERIIGAIIGCKYEKLLNLSKRDACDLVLIDVVNMLEILTDQIEKSTNTQYDWNEMRVSQIFEIYEYKLSIPEKKKFQEKIYIIGYYQTSNILFEHYGCDEYVIW